MKNFKICVFVIITIFLSGLSLRAQTFPTFYLRGEFTNPQWTNLDYAFSRDGNTYSIFISELNGKFKISNADWKINYGGQKDNIVITSSTEIIGVNNGFNFEASGLKNVTISFDYDASSTSTLLSIKSDTPAPPVKYGSGTLPLLFINVFDENGNYDNEIISKDLAHKEYFKGEYWLDLNGCTLSGDVKAESIGSSDDPLPLQIKARGNFTRTGFSKKPFKLKLDKKQSLLGLSKSKHFAILAHADDSFGYMRNYTGFNLGNRIGLPWTPSQQPVEVVINGDYRGLYFLTESIRVEESRINIQELEDNVSDVTLASGGYLVELDNYEEENQIRMPEKGFGGENGATLMVTFDTPEEYSDLQRRFITQQFSAINDAVGEAADSLWSYLDLDDAVRYYIVEEILSHVESYHGSTYLFRDRGENQKWHFSPLWDCGQAFNGPTNKYFTSAAPYGNTWIAAMRRNKKFMEKVSETWKWFMSNKFDGLYEELDAYAGQLVSAAASDYSRWHNAPLPNSGFTMPVVDNRNMEERLKNVKNHLESKIKWLCGQFGEYADQKYPEPERDETPAAALPDFMKGGQNGVDSVSLYDDPLTEIFTLQGQRVEKMQPGNIYIIKRGCQTEKILIQ